MLLKHSHGSVRWTEGDADENKSQIQLLLCVFKHNRVKDC